MNDTGSNEARFDTAAETGVSIPRSVSAAELYARLLIWLDTRQPGLTLEAEPGLKPVVAARQFARHQGTRLALLHATNAASLDPETLLHPVIERRALVGHDPAVTAHERSVVRTLIPDLIPELAPDPVLHLDDLLRGFALAYDAICRDADSFCRELAAGADIATRFVARPAYQYLAYLAQPSQPGQPAGESDLEPAFDAADALLDAERRDLAAGDLPVFSTRPGCRAVWTSRGERLDDVVPVCGLDSALAKVRAMGPRDRRRQEWMIEAAFAAASAPVRHWCLATGSVGGTDGAGGTSGTGGPDPERALDQAEAVARELDALTHRDRRRVNWLGLEPLEDGRWTVLPSGLGLGHGYSGIALFLARLGALTGRPQHLELAAAAMAGAPALVAALAERPGHLAAIGGGFAGLDGVSYALEQLSVLLESAELRDAAELAADLAGHPDVRGRRAAAQPGLFEPGLFNDSWCSGVASLAAGGALDAADRTLWLARLASTPPLGDLTVCHGEFGVLEALTILAEGGDEQARVTLHRRAARLPDPVASGAAYSGTPGAVPTPGFLHGLAGVGYGLLRVAFPEKVPSVLTLEPSR